MPWHNQYSIICLIFTRRTQDTKLQKVPFDFQRSIVPSFQQIAYNYSWIGAILVSVDSSQHGALNNASCISIAQALLKQQCHNGMIPIPEGN